MRSSDDRSTRARIRDAAIDVVARDGTSDLSARRVAQEAGVSPGSVIHHFGSMDGLRTACDEYVAQVIRERKSQAVAGGPGLDIAAALRDPAYSHLTAYLAAVVGEDSPALARLVDDLVADAVEYSTQGVQAGMLVPSDDEHARAALLVIWSLGGLVLHRHLARHLGVDLTDPATSQSPGFARYVAAAYETIGRGMFTEALLRTTEQAVTDLATPREDTA